MEGRDIVVGTELKKFLAEGKKVIPENSQTIDHPSLIGDIQGVKEAWAMVIDLTTCIGCKACTIACQAENNIPIVGKEQVRNGREMHWIRVDRYFEGSASSPKIYFQPVPCMHCEKAPCEYVCPTGATVHSHDGLNQMVYNRCVGTRYCSNNCPYKVRRFNFFQYADTKSKSIQLMYNPDVTVRSRGVMEKCTYCIQRIQEVRIQAEKENRPIRDGEVVTACAQACPTEAITFGDKNNATSRVAKVRSLPQHYFLLAELGTKPRTSYLASISNPNPSMSEGG
jgi:molybdopterin-containing oxidoreductase family iron-sulfur binding subunit